ncbi:MAG TPA: ADOP family duplicated permease [Vicinamibacterales bacterium]|nr:ADOP family duplicated permease [Vicinamibacterales bacterium]
MLSDIKFSFRQLTKAPGFSLASVVVLALGIGLNAAMFSVIYAIAFIGRPYPAPDRLMQLYSSQSSQPDSYRAFSYAAYRELAAERDLFAGVLAHNPTLVGVSDRGGDARRAFAALVSRNYFDVLGAPMVQGRGFSEEEDRPGRDIPVVVATYAYWQRRGLDPTLVGSTIRVNERPYTVIGITARGFTGTMSVFGPELFFPLGVFTTLSNDFEGQAQRTLERPDAFNLFLVARLADGVTREAASDRLQAIGRRLEQAFPAHYKDARITLAPLPRIGTSTSPSDESALRVVGAVLLGLTGAVLLTVSLNLASMLMARGRARRREFAIRLAIGGGRGRIIRQLLVEGFMLSLAGGAGGVVLALYAVGALVTALTTALPITIVLDGASSPALVLATLVFCVLATVWSALGPALRHSRVDVLTDLKPQPGEDARERRRRFLPRNPLVVAQVSLSVALLIAAGLFVRMAQGAVSVDFGFRADDTVLAEVDSGLAGYTTAQSVDLYAEIERRLRALPGVDAAGVGALVPLGMVNIGQSVRRAGIEVPPGEKPQTAERGRAFDAPWNAVSGQYFKAMGVAILDGRTFTDVESFGTSAPKVVVLDEALARRLWPEGGAIGQRIEFETRERSPSQPATSYEVVGIVASTRRQLFERELPGAVYVPFAQGAMGNAYFHVRPHAPQAGLPDAVRQTIKAAAPTLPIFSARTYAAHIGSSLEYWALRLSATLFGTFGVLAVVVALVGIYGVLSHTVSRRTREIGIRLAIGAAPGTVIRMILGEGLVMTLAGVGLGWLAGLGVGRLLASIFVDLAPFDPITFTAIPAAFVVAALAAAWLPARRATLVNPVAALRSE